MTDGERKEFQTAWETWCFNVPEGSTMGSTFCTLPKGHSGGHVCDYDKVDRYNELRWAQREVAR